MSIVTEEARQSYLVLLRFSSIPACAKMLAPGPLVDSLPLALAPGRSPAPPENKFMGTKMHYEDV